MRAIIGLMMIIAIESPLLEKAQGCHMHLSLQRTTPNREQDEITGLNKTVTQLLELLGSEDFGERTHAARKLGEMKAKEAVRPLIKVLNHSDLSTRAIAAWALSQIGSKEAIIPLVAALKRGVKEIRINSREWKTVLSIATSIERLTGQKFGTDVQLWEDWIELKQK
jgi:hypothetical protein